VSFWYLANHLGKRFLRDVIEFTGNLEAVSPGLWHGRVLGRPLWLVSNGDVPIDVESAPVSMVSEQSTERALELARVAVSSDELWETYGPLLGTYFPNQTEEFSIMATKQGRKKFDMGVVARNAVKAASAEELVKSGVAEEVVDKIGLDRLDRILAALKPEELRELVKKAASAKK
jgi:hypothetical protein